MAEAVEQRALPDEVQQLLVALDQRRPQPLHGHHPRGPPALPQLGLLDPRERALAQISNLHPEARQCQQELSLLTLILASPRAVRVTCIIAAAKSRWAAFTRGLRCKPGIYDATLGVRSHVGGRKGCHVGGHDSIRYCDRTACDAAWVSACCVCCSA